MTGDIFILRTWGPCFSHLENFWGPGDRPLPLLEKHKVQVRLIFSLFTLSTPERQVSIQVLPAVLDMAVKGPILAQPTRSIPGHVAVCVPCHQLDLESCLRS